MPIGTNEHDIDREVITVTTHVIVTYERTERIAGEIALVLTEVRLVEDAHTVVVEVVLAFGHRSR